MADEKLTADMGDILATYVATSKQGKKLQALKENIDKSKQILKTLDPADTLEVAKEKVNQILPLLYSRHNLENQQNYLKRKRTTLAVVTQAYHIVLAKEEGYEKSYDKMIEDLEG